MKKHFFGFEYWDGKNTTTGNGFRGRYSSAGTAYCFTSKKARDEWVEEGYQSRGGREACTKAELEYHFRGMTPDQRYEALQILIDEAECSENGESSLK